MALALLERRRILFQLLLRRNIVLGEVLHALEFLFGPLHVRLRDADILLGDVDLFLADAGKGFAGRRAPSQPRPWPVGRLALVSRTAQHRNNLSCPDLLPRPRRECSANAR